ncbi:alanine racemase [Labilibacter sediminis]|nr:alanine racemase [Labilibacter sediminis]
MHKISEPTLILNETICKDNIWKMVSRVSQWNGDFRPHFKTHQSAVVGEWFRSVGVERITVSSFAMANYFAANGWKDITVALTSTVLNADVINELSSKINLNIIVEDEESIKLLEKQLSYPVGLFIKVDGGYHRTGVDADDLPRIKKLKEPLKESKNLIFMGFLIHAGNTYYARSQEQLEEIVKPQLEKVLALKTFLKDDFPLLQISWGDTPSCSMYSGFYGIDEFRPGNFVYYDYTQVQIGSCELKDIAVCMAVPVLALHPERNEIVVHGGAVHLSKDRVELSDGSISFGKAVVMNGLTWDVNCEIGEVKSLSQEHGIIKADETVIRELKPGDVIGIIPVHSCLTANLMKELLCTDGNFIDMIK